MSEGNKDVFLPAGVPDGIAEQHAKAMRLLREAHSWIIPKGNISVSIFERIGAFLDSAAPTVKAEQVQCESTELALLREYRASAMAFSLAHGPDVSLPAFDRAEKRLEAAEKACHDFYAGCAPSLPAAGSDGEEVEIVGYVNVRTLLASHGRGEA